MRTALFVLALVSVTPCFGAAALAGGADGAGPYRVIRKEKVGGEGRWDYVYADSGARRLYIPRSTRVTVFNLDTLKPEGEIAQTPNVHGVAVDPGTQHAFSSSRPVVMWDDATLKTIKTIATEGNPDGILFDAASGNVLVLSHREPNVTAISAANGTVVGTLNLGGAPEQAASDGTGRVYIDLENKDKVAVVDSKGMKLVTTYDLQGKGGGPAGLALDAKHHILFAACHNPATCVVLNAETGKILETLPIGKGVDSAEFNPETGEAFVSTGDGVLTVIKEKSPTEFAVEQSLKTMAGARTSTLDEKTGHVFLVTAAFEKPAAGQEGAEGGRRRRRGMVAGSFTILEVGR